MNGRVKDYATGKLDDATERWLKANDPLYAAAKREWIVPKTDSLARARSETNEVHSTLEDLAEMSPKGHGHYHRHASIDDLEAPADDGEPE